MNQGSSRSQPASLRRRIRAWTAAVMVAAIALLTAVSIVEERSHVLSIQSAAGRSLVEHLVQMPLLQHGEEGAAKMVAALSEGLRASGGRLELVPVDAPASGEVLAREALSVEGAHLELRYTAEPSWIRGVTTRAIAIHAVLGALVLAATLMGVDRILARHLVSPLRAISHQIRHMRRGGGWEPRLPPADEELAEVTGALRELGPALGAQVAEWLEAERRAAAAVALGDLRTRLRQRRQRTLALLGDLQARGWAQPEGLRRVRAALLELEGMGKDFEATAAAAAGATVAAPPPGA